MAPISSEDLEHVEDKKLDAAYESHLERTGDDLMPLPTVRELLDSLIADDGLDEDGEKILDTSNRAIGIAVSMGAEDDEDVETELPELPSDPSNEQLIEYASLHPDVRPILKLFRGKVISVKKSEK